MGAHRPEDGRPRLIHIALSGSKGRMGQSIQGLLADGLAKCRPPMQLSCEYFHGQSEDARRKSLEKPIDVWIDFSTPEASLDYCRLCRSHGWKMVIGTTGFSESQKAFIQEASESIPILLAPNMSIGHALMLQALAMLAGTTGDCDIGIVDIHHQHKKDQPSGTALAMAKVMNDASAHSRLMPEIGTDQATTSTPRISRKNIVSLRLGDAIGEHQALFALRHESLSIKHVVHHRSVFAEGALKAAAWISRVQNPGLYTMQDVLAQSREA